MTHFQTKDHLLMWLEANCPRKGIVRALRDGQVELLGGFSLIPPTTQPGWIVRVTSVRGKEFIVAVIAYQNRYGIRVLKGLTWEHWKHWANGIGDLHNGDNPRKCEFMKKCADDR